MMIGLDPGSKQTGMILLDRGRVLAATLLSWDDTTDWMTHSVEICELLDEWLALEAPDKLTLIRVEDTVKPVGHLGMIDVGPLLTVSKIIGALTDHYPTRVQLVRPGGHGSRQPLRVCYPPEIIGKRETTGTGGKWRHIRSAFDVAMSPGESMWRG